MLPMVEEMIQRAGRAGVLEIIIGMPHRGRLNLLVNTLENYPVSYLKSLKGVSIII